VTPRLGLRENLPQFALLVLINAFVGGRSGSSAQCCRCSASASSPNLEDAITSFIVSFGVTKAVLNLVGARLSERFGRTPILVVAGSSRFPCRSC